MNIVLITNTYAPHVGGVARSVEAFRNAYRSRGHRVLVVAPSFPEMPEAEEDVVRLPALQNFNASDFSVALPLPVGLRRRLEAFAPDVIHSQHPFLLGTTALRLARTFKRPLLFTHHTLYERYTHYVPGDSEAMKCFIIELATCYANLADRVLAPSESIRDILLDRGVTTPVSVVPTGVDVERFASGDGAGMRRRLTIDPDAHVVGHLGRLAPEKNIAFLTRAVCDFLAGDARRVFLVIGDGEAADELKGIVSHRGLTGQLRLTGTLEGRHLVDALAASDVFAFASSSETQGMVLTEAMAAGLPVVALDASGVREVVRDHVNGRLLPSDATEAAFAGTLGELSKLPPKERSRLVRGARSTAADYAMDRCADKALAAYRRLHLRSEGDYSAGDDLWDQVRLRISAELDILRTLNSAGSEAVGAAGREDID
ncbi:MAG: glycosyltransferase [Halieaceae bacterium]|nr:glycosyltransferase [Halieaceae bacterium]